MKNVLLAVQIETHFVELSRLARLLSSTGTYRPIFWFHYEYATLDRDLEVCRSEGWEYINPKEFELFNPVPIKEKPLKLFLKRIIKGNLRAWIHHYRATSFHNGLIKELESQAKSIINNKISLIVLSEDNVGYLTNIIIRCGTDIGIHSVIMPYTIANATEAAEYLFDLDEYSATTTWIHRKIARKYPQWVYEHRGRKLLRLPPAAIIAIEKSRYSCDNPWHFNNEKSTIIAVENNHMLQYYRDEGIEEKRLVLTGALYDDVLTSFSQRVETNKEMLIKKFDLVKDQPILLCALPPDQFPRICDFIDYPDLVKYWMESLSSIKGWNVLIRPHPRQTPNDIAKIDKFGLQVTTLDTAGLVPLCDLYIASVSATIRWAIACGKPVINYDAYCMNYRDYSEVTGVLTVDSRKSFNSILTKITSDKPFFQEIQEKQLSQSKSWGKLDGKSSERIIQLIDDIILEKYTGEAK